MSDRPLQSSIQNSSNMDQSDGDFQMDDRIALPGRQLFSHSVCVANPAQPLDTNAMQANSLESQ